MSTVDPCPVAILLATKGSRGDRLLFRYPFEPVENNVIAAKETAKNPYGIKIAEDIHNSSKWLDKDEYSLTSNIRNSVLVGFSNEILANLFAIQTPLCDQEFDVKIDDVRFIGYPMVLDYPASKSKPTGSHLITSFHIVFGLRAVESKSVVNCYYALAKQVAAAIKHEQKRCSYLSTEAKYMRDIMDEVAGMPEDFEESPFKMMLKKSQLAMDLKTIYDSLFESGVVHLFINHWIEINFCLPHKIHKLQPEIIKKSLSCLRPFHGVLLLEDTETLLSSLPFDCSPTLTRLIRISSPLRNLQGLALDTDLSVSQILQLVSHLVYWAKAMVIYPLCETNVYVLSPQADTYVHSSLVEEFSLQFPGRSLPVELGEFSFPTKLRESRDVLEDPRKQAQRVTMVVWMLQHKLLIQLHTYIFLVPPVQKKSKKISEEMVKSSSGLKMPIVVEESSSSLISDDASSSLTRTASFSDIASVNSDESTGLGSFTRQLSKSPSTSGELMSESSEDIFPAHLTKDEKDVIYSVPASKDPDDFKLFIRLCPYFNGEHHIEEIMYYENMTRSQLLTVLDKFHSVLITCTKYDPATVYYAGT